jgi:septum site-determining protein MinD
MPLLAADACVLVATPTAVALPDVLRTRALARELDAGIAAVALNRVGDAPPVDRVRRALGAPVVPVPESESLARAQAAGHPVASVEPDADATWAFRALADAVPVDDR